LGLSKVKADVAEIDRVTESILAWNSAAARKADIATAAREVTRQWLRAAILVAVLALLASFLVWRVREVTHARLASAVKARRHQEELNTKLEKLVAARTHELAQSIDQLRESQSQLIQTGKMVAVGQLAAGIAHEINTPIQFVGDSVSFIHSAVRDMLRLLDCYAAWIKSAQTNGPTMAVEIARAEEEADLPYLVENLPKAIDRSLEGLDRVSTIVRSMKEFAHPEQREMTTVDLNHALESTLIIARSEYKYVADVTTDLGDLPQVLCYAGELNQVFLNILVNAAHAIASKVKDTNERGTITVRTRREGTSVVVSIGDTGTGIPRKIWERVFDPFFTTKEVGKGTGQGLAIAHSVVVDKHGGQLTFESEEGKGTTFCIRLPIQGKGEENEKEPQGAL
jgi:signal transduction histidine kinase